MDPFAVLLSESPTVFSNSNRLLVAVFKVMGNVATVSLGAQAVHTIIFADVTNPVKAARNTLGLAPGNENIILEGYAKDLEKSVEDHPKKTNKQLGEALDTCVERFKEISAKVASIKSDVTDMVVSG